MNTAWKSLIPEGLLACQNTEYSATHPQGDQPAGQRDSCYEPAGPVRDECLRGQQRNLHRRAQAARGERTVRVGVQVENVSGVLDIAACEIEDIP